MHLFLAGRSLYNQMILFNFHLSVQLPCPAGRAARHEMDGPPPCPNNTVVSGGTLIVSAAVEGDHVMTSSKKNCQTDSNAARHSNDIIAVGKALSGTNGHRSSSGKNSGNSMIGAMGNGNYEAKSGSFNYMMAASPTTEATNATSGFCHSRSTGVLGAVKWNGIGTGSEGGIVRQESPPSGQRALEPGIGVNRSSPFLHHDEPVLRFSVPFRNNPMLRNS